jgi:hypothetical protein
MEGIIADSLGQQRLTMSLLGGFAGIALVLAVVGIYGAVAYTVEQRTGEIGVRMALGAQTADVLRMVLKQGMTPVIIGLGIGLAATFAVGRLLQTQLYEVKSTDPFLLSATAVTLTVVAVLACLIPARRATLVNPSRHSATNDNDSPKRDAAAPGSAGFQPAGRRMLRRRTFELSAPPGATRQGSVFRQHAETSRLKTCAPQAFRRARAS